MRAGLAGLGALAAGCLVLGSALDWSGVAYSSTVDRRLAFAAGAGVATATAVGLLWSRRALALNFPAAVLGLNMGIVNVRDIAGHRYEYASYPDAAVGVGLYLVLAGAALAMLVGAAALLPRRWLDA